MTSGLSMTSVMTAGTQEVQWEWYSMSKSPLGLDTFDPNDLLLRDNLWATGDMNYQ